jgi:hypothetical protein
MEELTPTPLKRPLTTTNNDAAVLRALVTDINARLPGAGVQAVAPVLTPEQKAQSESVLATEFAKAESVENIPVEAQRAASSRRNTVQANATPQVPETGPATTPDMVLQAPNTPVARPARLFVTGHPGAIDRLVKLDVPGTRVVSLSVTALEILKDLCFLKGTPPAKVISEFRKFGDGEFEPTLEKLLSLGRIRTSWVGFASPGFWAQCVLDATPDNTEDQLIVVGVRTSVEFKALQAAGFKHFHVMATPGTAQRRTPTGYNGELSALSQALDSSTHKQISAQRNGQRLNVVWNDDSNPPSGRFISAAQFQKEVLGREENVVELDNVSQIL